MIFETSIGACGIAWSRTGVIGVQLPEEGANRTRTRLRERFPEAVEEAPPLRIERWVAAIVRLLEGQASDLSSILLDMERLSPFHRRVYEAARTIPSGTTLSYGELSKRVGSPNSARAVGQALGKNPYAIIVPCHRVIAANGKLGGFSARGGTSTKLRMLAIERAQLENAKPRNGSSALCFEPETALSHLRRVDPDLAQLIDRVGAFELQLKGAQSTFATLVEAVVHQQLSTKAAGTILARLCALFPGARRGLTARGILESSDEVLRGAGLSRAKVLALRDLAEKQVRGGIPGLAKLRGMKDDAIIERLTQVRGIGRWTVEMLLIFHLGRGDVLPAGDLGLRSGFASIMGGVPSPKELERHGERWRPYRSVASWYLWRAGGTIPRRTGTRRPLGSLSQHAGQ